MRALVTGAAGFAGQWLARALLAAGWEVTGCARQRPVGGILTPDEQSAVSWVDGDVRDPAHLRAALDAASPDAIAHLAAVTFIPAAAADPAAAFETNAVAAVRLLHEVAERRRAGDLDPVVLLVGSAEQYGRQPAEAMPLREDAELRPVTAYAASKCAQEVAGGQAHRAHGLRVVMTRSFGHSGPGQSERYLLPGLVRRALDARGGPAPGVLRVGNLDPVRDFLHVGDAVRAYIMLLERGVAGQIYNVSSGQGRSVAELLARVLERVGVHAAPLPDPALVRPADVPILVGDAAKLRHDTGWAPSRSCDDIIDDLIHAATH